MVTTLENMSALENAAVSISNVTANKNYLERNNEPVGVQATTAVVVARYLAMLNMQQSASDDSMEQHQYQLCQHRQHR